MGDSDPGLDAALRELYAAFSRHPLRPEMGYCPHCVGPADVQELIATPLHQLSAGLMARYVRDGMAETWGDWEDLRHFLPRILELLANGELVKFSLFEMLFQAIGIYAKGWPADERSALAAYLRALWQHIPPDPPEQGGTARELGSITASDVTLAADELGVVLQSS